MANMSEVADSFVGCILTLKTKPGEDGISENIIGTVRYIDTTEQTITLDEAMCNGEILPDGFVLRSSQIADLNVCGKAVGNEVLTLVEADFRVSPVISAPIAPIVDLPKSKLADKKPSELNVLENEYPENKIQYKKGGNGITTTTSQLHSINNPFVKNELQDPDEFLSSSSSFTSWKTPISEKQINIKIEPEESKTKSKKPLNISSGISSSPIKLNNNTQTIQTSQTKLSTTKPSILNTQYTKDPRVVYVASELERNYFEKSKSIKNEQRGLLPFPKTNIGTTPPSSSGHTRGQKYPQLTLQNTTPTCVLQKLIQNSNISTTSTNGTSNNNQLVTHNKETMASDNVFLTLLRRPQKQQEEEIQGQSQIMLPKLVPQNQRSIPLNPLIQNVDRNQKGNLTPGRQNGSSGNGKQLPKHESTFDMTNDEILAEEFNFERSNAMFEKLPVDSKKPIKVQKEPQFGQSDTTFLADRMVESIKLGQGVKSVKNFVSDTGIIIPAVDMRTRSKILNAAHSYGLTHSRMVEVMGRAVAQTCIPFLGNSFRLSPERVDDRPTVLICTGPHWQGAAGICAARILASQGVHTYVLAKKRELNLCEIEEKLYCLTGQKLTREVTELTGLKFDLIIYAVDSHTERDLSLGPVYFSWMQNKPVVLIDPPVLKSYRRCFEGEMYSEMNTSPPSRLCLLTPTLPLAYGNDSSTKIFLVNMGIPQGIFAENGILYKSPFGDKLTIQIFSEKQVVQIQQQLPPNQSSQ